MLSKKQIGTLLLAGTLAFGVAGYAETVTGTYDGQIQNEISKQLQKTEFKDVHASVENGVVILQGTVNTYKQKLDAVKQARKQGHVQGVRDLLQVAGPTVPDAELRDRIAAELRYNPYSFNNVFDVLTVGVKDGRVTLGGEVRTPTDHDSAVAIVENMSGVKDVVDQIKVAPTSSFDDSLRLRLLRALYRDPALARYAMDPQAPIRIVVDNGHVGLYGVVANDMDRQLAYMRANSVPGAFSVDNHLTTESVAR